MKAQDLYVGFAFSWADVLVHADRSLRVRDVFGAVQNLLGRDPSTVAGRPLSEMFAAEDTKSLARLTTLRPGSRIAIDGLTVAPESGNTVSLSAIKLETAPDTLCIALREMTPAGETPRGSLQGLVQRATSFARQSYGRMRGNDASAIGIVTLEGIGDLKARMARADTDQLGEALRARVDALIGQDDACMLIDEDSYAFVDVAGHTPDAVKGAIQDASRELDPEHRGVTAHTNQIDQKQLGELNEGDFVNGLVCSLSRFCQAREHGLSVADLAANFSNLVADAVKSVRDFGKLVNDGHFTVFLQPIVETRSGQIHHYEALCRFEADQSPAERLLFAEQAGMIHQFDLAMISKVIAWLEKQPRNRRSARIAVNMSGRSLETPGFLDALEQLLDANPWLDDRLIFEVTETARATDLKASNSMIQRVRQRRHPVCLDDFGAGAASFQYLAELEVDIVKLDGSALDTALRSERGRAFLAALVEFCRRLGVHTVAEMVETRQHLQIARQCGVDYVQGYMFGKPSRHLSDFQPLPNAAAFKAGVTTA